MRREHRGVDWKRRIIRTADTCFGKPRIKGTRITVDLILGFLYQGWTIEAILESYPHVTRDDVLAALGYARDLVGRRRLRGSASSPPRR